MFAVSVFPPATDKITITADQEISSVTITDVLGKTVFVSAPDPGRECQVNLQHIQPGIYQAIIKTQQGSCVQRIVKN